MQIICNVALGGGLADVVPAAYPLVRPFAFVAIGIVAYGMCSCLVAFLSGPLVDAFESISEFQPSKTVRTATLQYIVLSFVILPVVLILVMALDASLVFLAGEPQLFGQAFWLALPVVSGGAVSVATEDMKSGMGMANADGTLGASDVVAILLGASVGFFLLSAAIGIGGTILGPVIDRMGLGESGSHTVRSSLCVLLMVCFFGIPALVAMFAVPVGGLLAVLEGWTFGESFWWCVAIQLGGGMSLSDAKVTDNKGRFLAVIMTGVSIGISTLSVSLSGSPAVEPLIEAIGLKLRDKDAEEFRQLVEEEFGEEDGEEDEEEEEEEDDESGASGKCVIC